MIIEDITCNDRKSCHDLIKLNHPTVIMVTHIQNNHIIVLESDRDDKGNISQSIHDKCWELGGIEKELCIKLSDGNKKWIRFEYGDTKDQAIKKGLSI